MPLLSLPELRARTSGLRNLSKSLNEVEIQRGAIKSTDRNHIDTIFCAGVAQVLRARPQWISRRRCAGISAFSW